MTAARHRHRLSPPWAWMLTACVGASAGIGCHAQPMPAPEPGLERMVQQPKVLPFAADPGSEGATPTDDAQEAAAPRSAMRAPPAGTVAWDAPPPVPRLDRAALERGEQLFDALCAACHGVRGDGVSPVARRMTLIRPRDLTAAPAAGYDRQRLVQVMEQGYGLMPSLATQLDRSQRWEVAGYVKALQLSRHVPLAQLPVALAAQARGALP